MYVSPLYPNRLIYQLMNFHKTWSDHHAIEYTIAERDRNFLLFRSNAELLTPHLPITIIIIIIIIVICSTLIYKLLGVLEIPNKN
jgi:hypothetical protein